MFQDHGGHSKPKIVIVNKLNIKRIFNVVNMSHAALQRYTPFQKNRMPESPTPASPDGVFSDEEPLMIKQVKLKKQLSKDQLQRGNSSGSLHKSSSLQSLQAITKSSIRETAKDCVCASVINPANIKCCNICNGHFEPILKLFQDRAMAYADLNSTKQKLENMAIHERDQGIELIRARKRIDTLMIELERKNDELITSKNDMEILGQKLLDEMEARQAVQTSKDQLSEELENLTQSLFEEANNMVAHHSKERYGAQQEALYLDTRLQEISGHLLVEQKTSTQLRVRLAKMQQVLDELNALSKKSLPPIDKIEPPKIETPNIDDILFKHFQELYLEASNLRASKLHTLMYMKNALEDDVKPCLRFGGNPRTSTSKFIDAIIANNCFIEEMTSQQIEELKERDIRNKQIAKEQAQAAKMAPTPTVSLFNYTVLEKISNALTISSKELEGEGCATCGREQPYKYRFKISDVHEDSWYPICLNCRDRILSVVDFYQFIRNIKQGLYPGKDVQELYFYGVSLKRNMFYTRIGAGNLVTLDEAIGVGSFLASKEGESNIAPSPVQPNRL